MARRRASAAPVMRVVDGDTFEARIDGEVEDVRLIGVDTPETVKPGTPVQCYGPRASDFTHHLLEGRTVRLVLRRRAPRHLRPPARLRPPRRPLRQRDAGPPRPRADADDPAQRPLRPVSAPARAAAARAGRGLWGACGPRRRRARLRAHRHFALAATTRAALVRSAAGGPRSPSLLSMRMRQSISQFEVAFEQETIVGAPPARAAAPPRGEPLARAPHGPQRAARQGPLQRPRRLPDGDRRGRRRRDVRGALLPDGLGVPRAGRTR